jgi:hypothetical protein
VEVEGDIVTLSLEGRTCVVGSWDTPRVCASDCRNLDVTCEIPALAAGRYRVVTVPGEWPSKATLDRELVVTEGAGEESCLDPLSPDVER